MKKMLLQPLHGSSRPGLKKNRREYTSLQQRRLGRFFRAAFLFPSLAILLILTGCNRGSGPGVSEQPIEQERQDILHIQPRPASNGLGGVELDIYWSTLGERIFLPDSRLNFRQHMVYSVVLRNEALFTGRIQYRKRFVAGYDPYTELYYIEDGGNRSQETATSIPELKQLLGEPVVLYVPAADLNELRSGKIQVSVRAYLPYLGPDSVFARWLNLFFRSRFAARGEAHFFL